MTRQQIVARWFSAAALISAGLVWLHVLGAGELAAPPLSLDGVTEWLERTETIVVAFTFLRVLAMSLGAYLLVVVSLGCVSRCLALPRMTSLVDRFTVPFARSMFGGLAMLGVMAAPSPVARTATAPEQVTLHLVQDAPTTTAPAPEPAPTPATAVPDERVWVVAPGESLWSIATSHLAEVRGRAVSDQEVTPYWQQVIELNRTRLVHPDNIDLLFSGQTLELPAVG